MQTLATWACAAGVLVLPSWARAEVIQEVTVGPDIETFFLGQSVLIPIGGPWNRLSFNWFGDGPGTIPTATGSLFVLDQEYLGTPNLLSSSTPGFVGQSQSISGGMYEFAPNIQI